MTSPASNGRHATGKPLKATWLSKPTPNTCLFAGRRQPAEDRSSWVMGPLQLAPTRVPVRAQSCSSFPKLHPLLSPLPWRQCSSLMRPFGARLQSRCPARLQGPSAALDSFPPATSLTRYPDLLPSLFQESRWVDCPHRCKQHMFVLAVIRPTLFTDCRSISPYITDRVVSCCTRIT